MSSVQSFLRQRVVGTRTAAVPAIDASGGVLYQFVPAVGNYVGNYPPGYMVDVSVTVGDALTAQGGLPVMRDMGKTIKAVISAAGVQPADLATNAGFFREYQILVPTVVPGPTSSSNFGVIGGPTSPTAYTSYFTVYVPIEVGGTYPGVAAGSGGVAPRAAPPALLADGQL
jgi:hypothetical protein